LAPRLAAPAAGAALPSALRRARILAHLCFS
jgi:hypothetical protein